MACRRLGRDSPLWLGSTQRKDIGAWRSPGVKQFTHLTQDSHRARERRLGRLGTVSGRSGTHLTGQVVVVHRSRSSCRERRRLRPQAFDPAEDLGEQGARHCDLSQLEHDVAAMAHDPGADLHQLLAQRRQRPMLDLRRRRKLRSGGQRNSPTRMRHIYSAA
jgi:hypothetical protein